MATETLWVEKTSLTDWTSDEILHLGSALELRFTGLSRPEETVIAHRVLSEVNGNADVLLLRRDPSGPGFQIELVSTSGQLTNDESSILRAEVAEEFAILANSRIGENLAPPAYGGAQLVADDPDSSRAALSSTTDGVWTSKTGRVAGNSKNDRFKAKRRWPDRLVALVCTLDEDLLAVLPLERLKFMTLAITIVSSAIVSGAGMYLGLAYTGIPVPISALLAIAFGAWSVALDRQMVVSTPWRSRGSSRIVGVLSLFVALVLRIGLVFVISAILSSVVALRLFTDGSTGTQFEGLLSVLTAAQKSLPLRNAINLIFAFFFIMQLLPLIVSAIDSKDISQYSQLARTREDGAILQLQTDQELRAIDSGLRIIDHLNQRMENDHNLKHREMVAAKLDAALIEIASHTALTAARTATSAPAYAGVQMATE